MPTSNTSVRLSVSLLARLNELARRFGKTRNALIEEAVVAHWREELMEIMPTKDRVLVRRVKVAERSSGGISIPETLRDNAPIAVVVASGPECVAELAPGTRVVLSKFAGSPIDIGGTDHLLLSAEDVLATVKGA